MTSENKTSQVVEDLFRNDRPGLMELSAIQEKYRKMQTALQQISNDYRNWQHDIGPKPDLELIAEVAGEALAFDPLQ